MPQQGGQTLRTFLLLAARPRLLIQARPTGSKPRGKPNPKFQSHLRKAAEGSPSDLCLPLCCLPPYLLLPQRVAHSNPHAIQDQGTAVLPDPSLGLPTPPLLPLFRSLQPHLGLFWQILSDLPAGLGTFLSPRFLRALRLPPNSHTVPLTHRHKNFWRRVTRPCPSW